MERSDKLEILHKTVKTCCPLLTVFALSIFGMWLLNFESGLYFSSDIHEFSLSKTTLPYGYYNKKDMNKFVDMIRIKNEPLDTFKGRDILWILFINKPKWVNISKQNGNLKRKCNFKNCFMTDVVKNISQMRAVVFSTQDRLEYNSSYLKRNRPFSQVWIFFRFEPPDAYNRWYIDQAWTNTMNWSWGYRLDSDIFRPIQVLTTKSVLPYRDYDNIFKRKKKLAAWVVSNCHAQSLRSQYVRALIHEGVQVDIFGKCSENKTRISQKEILKRINDDYKFYLSFENNFCKDYITEKFYTYLGVDTILIVRGGINYSEHFNPNAFIDTSLFPTVKALASYILRISRDIKLYTGYLRTKDIYNKAGSQESSFSESVCDLCEKLNNPERYRKNYESISVYLHNRTCFNPVKIL